MGSCGHQTAKSESLPVTHCIRNQSRHVQETHVSLAPSKEACDEGMIWFCKPSKASFLLYAKIEFGSAGQAVADPTSKQSSKSAIIVVLMDNIIFRLDTTDSAGCKQAPLYCHKIVRVRGGDCVDRLENESSAQHQLHERLGFEPQN